MNEILKKEFEDRVKSVGDTLLKTLMDSANVAIEKYKAGDSAVVAKIDSLLKIDVFTDDMTFGAFCRAEGQQRLQAVVQARQILFLQARLGV